jgi:hypothetical protein
MNISSFDSKRECEGVSNGSDSNESNTTSRSGRPSRIMSCYETLSSVQPDDDG